MTFKLPIIAFLCGLAVYSSRAGGSSPAENNPTPPDKEKLSYAVGTRMGLQMKDAKSRIDVKVAIQAIQDVLDGKPTMIQESDIPSVLNQARAAAIDGKDADIKTQFSYAGGMRSALMFKRTGFDLDSKIVGEAIEDILNGQSKMQEADTVKLFKDAAAYEMTKRYAANKVEGDKYLAENAKKPGVSVLPDGLQYEIVNAGDGPLATTNDLIFVKFRGTFVDGREFDHHNHFLTRVYGGIQGWKDVLPLMKVGSEWRLVVPPALAYGKDGMPSRGVGPDATVVYDLQLLSIAPPGGSYQVSSGIGNGSDVDASSPGPIPSK
jgi:FKBP-type peptidyl-prolyl cis-trans isomerase